MSELEQFTGLLNRQADWQPPEPFERETALPEFPTEALPLALGRFVEALAESLQVPVEMPALLSLGVLAAVLQRKYAVSLNKDWKEPLCLFCVAVANPAERKSAAINALFKPVEEFERETRKVQATALAQNQQKRSLLMKRLAAAEAAAARGKGGDDEVLALSAELAEFREMHPYRLLCDDTTPEKLVNLMAEHDGCITVKSSEAGVFDVMRGRYDNRSGLDFYLKGHAGDGITIDRIGRKTDDVPNPRLSLVLTVQPEALRGLLSDASFKGRGLCGRFLYAMCASKVGKRKISPPCVPDEVSGDYSQLLFDLLANPATGTLWLTERARDCFTEFQMEVEHKLGDEWETMRDWGGKFCGVVARVAGLLHAASLPDVDPAEIGITGETMAAAVRIGWFLAAHAEIAYGTMGADESITDAKYLWRRLSGAGKPELPKSAVLRLCQKFHAVDELNEPLRLLEDMGYLRVVEQRSGGRGRPSQTVQLNPMAIETNMEG